MSIELANRAAIGDLSPEVVAWMAEGMRRHLAGDDLEHAFGLDRATRLRERNRSLQEAARLLDTGEGVWHLAGRLEAAVRRYERRIKPQIAAGLATALAPVDAAIHAAFLTGCRVPTTRRNLFELIR